ncbi:uncharacterized protein isoform X2 [Danio rerio]|uniref:Uncharacterized protein isoform X2 n=1 Tax=Danio rerio TaxID=7955 RepID=A0AC58GBC4_DANRE
MCFLIPVVTNTRKTREVRCRRNPHNLRSIHVSTISQLSLSVGLWNCQSAVNKADFITSIATYSDYNLMALTETWLRPEDTATHATLSANFSFSHTPRQTGRGGGTGLLISKEWKFTLIPSLPTISSFEFHAVTIIHPFYINVVVIYRPPGDFNIYVDKPQAADFQTLLASFDLKRAPTSATHKSGNQLDLIYTRHCFTDQTIVTPLQISDHFLLSLNIHITPEPPHTPTLVTFRRNLRSLSPNRLSTIVSDSLPPSRKLTALDSNSATNTLCSTLASCLDRLCPLASRPARASPPAPWLSDALREHCSKLRAAERIWRKTKIPAHLLTYQTLLSSFSAEVTSAKQTYYRLKINNATNPRLLFKTFSSLLYPPPPPASSTLTTDDFATFFCTKTAKISAQFAAPTTNTQDTTPTPHTLTSFSQLSESEVSKLVLSSHATTCPLDPIPSHLLQAISPAVIPTLTHIINTSLDSGLFPTTFKQARVTPLLKKPRLDHTLLENYRPVSLLPFMAKILEKVVFNQVLDFLTQNNLMDNKQSGFKKGHSTETALLSVVEDLRLAKADSKSSVLILLDLSAAFDTVNHQILLSTLESLGVAGTVIQWFRSYLSDRSFRVSWRGEVSNLQHLNTGVPQGSVLGPLLFSIYTSSLGPVIQRHGFSYHCYADDTQLYLSFHPDDPSVPARISACLLDISHWMKDHHLQLNLAKTEMLVVSANPTLHHNFSIQMDGATITASKMVKSLGVTIDDQLNFSDHISRTARSCRFALYNIRKIRPFLSEYAAQLLVQALVLSKLDYCNSLLAGLPANSIKPLQLLQNAAARVVFNEPKRAHVTPLLVRLHWLPVAARIKFKTLMFAYKVTSGLAPSYLHSLLQIYVPSRNLRSVNERRLVVPSQRGKKSLSRTLTLNLPSWWNELPNCIRTAESLAIFKKRLKTQLFSLHFTS